PVSIDSPRQKRCIFVVRWHDDTVALETSEVFGQGQGNSGAAARIGCVSDHVLMQFGHESDARIFYTPDLLGILLRAGHQGRFTINLPPIDTVSRTRGAKMRQTAAVLDAAQEQ